MEVIFAFPIDLTLLVQQMRKQAKWIPLHGEALVWGQGKRGGCAVNSSDSSVPEPAHRGLRSIPGGGTATRRSWPRVFKLPGRGFQVNHQPRHCDHGRQEAEREREYTSMKGVGLGFVFNSFNFLILILLILLILVLNKSLCLLPYPSPTLDAGELRGLETVCPQQLWLELLGSTLMLINNSLFRALNWQRRRRWKQWPQSSQWLSQSCSGTSQRTPFWGTTQVSHLIFREDSSPRATEGKKRAFCSFYYWFNIYFNLNRNDPNPGGRFLWKYPFFAKRKGTVLAHRVLHRIAGLNFPNENILFFPPRRTAPKLILCCNYICKLSELGLQTVPAERGGKNHICKLRIVPYGFFPVSFFFFFSFFGFHYQIQSYFSLLQYFTINCN